MLRQLAEQAKEIMREDPAAVNVRDDWRQPVKVIRPVYAETQARAAGVTRPDLAGVIEMAFDGKTVGLYREADDVLPIIARAPEEERSDVYNMNSVQIWSSGTNRAVPLNQVATTMETVSDDNIVRRVDRKRALRVQCDQAYGNAEVLRQRIAPKSRPSNYRPATSSNGEVSMTVRRAPRPRWPVRSRPFLWV